MLRIAERAEGGAVVRLLDAAQDFAADADVRLERGDLGDVEELLGVVRGELLAQAVAAHRDGADAAPLAVAHLEDFADELLRGQIAGLVEDARVLVFDDGAALFELLDGHQHALRMSSGSKPVTTMGALIARADGEVFAVAHDGADVAGAEESLHAIFRRGEDGFERGRDEHVRDQQRDVGHLLFAGAPGEHGIGGGGGFEADGEEDDLFVGIGAGDLEAVQRRVDDAHVAAVGLDGEEVAIGAGHAQHVAKGAEDDVGAARDGVRLVDHLQRRDADRAAGAVHQFHAFGQKLVDAILHDGVGLAAADLHQHPGAGLDAAHLGDDFGWRRRRRDIRQDISLALLPLMNRLTVACLRPRPRPLVDYGRCRVR